MVDAFVNRSKETIYLVMDLVEGHSLKGYVDNYIKERHERVTAAGGLPECLAQQIVYQLLNIMQYLHSEEVSVCHRDVNPNNVMITPNNEFPIV